MVSRDCPQLGRPTYCEQGCIRNSSPCSRPAWRASTSGTVCHHDH
jgi:hypothetical protein